MNRNDDNALAALGGGAISALVWWDRLDRRTQDRLQMAREDARDALGQIQRLVTSPDFIRLLLPLVRDVIVGTALGSAQNPTPAPVPSLPTPPTRPNLSQENTAATMNWPPKAGVYDAAGNVETVGELTPFYLALTYPEVRAALVGLTQKEQLSSEGQKQVFRAFNQLVSVIADLDLPPAQYAAAWARLFTGLAGGGIRDPHQDPAKPPTITGLDPAVASAVPLTYPIVPYKQLNTDAGFRFRITATNAGIGAGAIICRVYFGTPFRYLDTNGMTQPIQPIVLISPSLPGLNVVNVTESSFDLQAAQSIAPLTTRDFFGSASAGQVTV